LRRRRASIIGRVWIATYTLGHARCGHARIA
jgi:hypothetical protein